MFRYLTNNLTFTLNPNKYFSKAKAIYIDASKFNQRLDGFIIYNCQKERAFKRVGVLLTALTAYSSFLYFYLCDDITGSLYLPLLGLSVAAMVAFEIKTRLTLRYLVLDRRGSQSMLIFYKWLGFGHWKRQVGVSSLRITSYSRWMQVPTIEYRVGEKRKMGFYDRRSVVEEQVFNEMMAGNSVRVQGKIKQGQGK